MKKDKSTFCKEYVQLLKKDRMLPISMDEAHEIIKDCFKDIIEDALEAELDRYLEYEKDQTSESTNSSRGDSLKIAKGILKKMDLKLPRDRDASFKPKILPQHKKDV